MEEQGKNEKEIRLAFKIVRISETSFVEPPYSSVLVNEETRSGDLYHCFSGCSSVALHGLFYRKGLVEREEAGYRLLEIASELENEEKIVFVRNLPKFFDEYELAKKLNFYAAWVRELHLETVIENLGRYGGGVLGYHFDDIQVGHMEFVELKDGNIFMGGIEVSLDCFINRCFCSDLNLIVFAERKDGLCGKKYEDG